MTTHPTIYIHRRGSDRNGNGSWERPFQTVAGAVQGCAHVPPYLMPERVRVFLIDPEPPKLGETRQIEWWWENPIQSPPTP